MTVVSCHGRTLEIEAWVCPAVAWVRWVLAADSLISLN